MNLVLSLLIIIVLTALGCVGEIPNSAPTQSTSVHDPFSCLNSDQMPAAPGDSVEQVGRVSQALFAGSATLWKNPDAKIPVCWEPASFKDEFAAEREIVRKSVESVWEKTLAHPRIAVDKQVKFIGWGPCGAGKEEVHINVADVRPHSEGIGTQLKGVRDGVTFNFTFKEWVGSPDGVTASNCSRTEQGRLDCIAAIAAHEFGHVLGIAHEQNRPDSPKLACTDTPAGSIGDLLLGTWDLHSMMNYCNPLWNNGGELSEGDQVGILAAYYPQLFSFQCLADYRTKAQAQEQLSLQKSSGVDTEAQSKSVEPWFVQEGHVQNQPATEVK